MYCDIRRCSYSNMEHEPSFIYRDQHGWAPVPAEWMSRVLEQAKIYQAKRTDNNATFEFDHLNDEFAETRWKIDFSQSTVSITVITDNESPILPASVSPLIFGVHYCVATRVVSWNDSAQASDVHTIHVPFNSTC